MTGGYLWSTRTERCGSACWGAGASSTRPTAFRAPRSSSAGATCVTAWLRPSSYRAFLLALKEHGYDGYLTYELCHPCLIGHRHFGLDGALRQVTLAAAFVRCAIARA